jgi:hypothetical protein
VTIKHTKTFYETVYLTKMDNKPTGEGSFETLALISFSTKDFKVVFPIAIQSQLLIFSTPTIFKTAWNPDGEKKTTKEPLGIFLRSFKRAE